MADGRDIIEDVNGIILDISGRTTDLGGIFAAEALAELEVYLESSNKWVKLCRKKVWLRGKQGTEMAQGCLDAAIKLKAALVTPSAAHEAAADLSMQLETLAQVIATKSQVLT